MWKTLHNEVSLISCQIFEYFSFWQIFPIWSMTPLLLSTLLDRCFFEHVLLLWAKRFVGRICTARFEEVIKWNTVFNNVMVHCGLNAYILWVIFKFPTSTDHLNIFRGASPACEARLIFQCSWTALIITCYHVCLSLILLGCCWRFSKLHAVFSIRGSIDLQLCSVKWLFIYLFEHFQTKPLTLYV